MWGGSMIIGLELCPHKHLCSYLPFYVIFFLILRFNITYNSPILRPFTSSSLPTHPLHLQVHTLLCLSLSSVSKRVQDASTSVPESVTQLLKEMKYIFLYMCACTSDTAGHMR